MPGNNHLPYVRGGDQRWSQQERRRKNERATKTTTSEVGKFEAIFQKANNSGNTPHTVCAMPRCHRQQGGLPVRRRDFGREKNDGAMTSDGRWQ